MHDLTAKRTIVKSPPELWSELSEVDRLARHLDAFGEIRITRLVPEHTVAWEGERASGTVSIEPSGWGTKVTLTAQLDGDAEVEVDEAPPAEEPASPDEPAEPEEPAAPEAPTAEAMYFPEGDAEAENEEPASAEPEVEEPRVAEPEESTEPGQIAPQRKRGFLAWLFRPRTSVAEPIATAPEPAVEPPAAETPEANIDRGPPEEAETDAPVAVVEASAAEPRGIETEREPDAEREPVAEREPAAAEPDVVETDWERTGDPELRDPAPVAAAVEADTSAEAVSDVAGGGSSLDPDDVQAVLDEVLDTLGSAHHRPFSRG